MQISPCIVLIAGLALAAPSHATDSWVIFAGGDKPGREAWVVDALTLNSRSDLMGFMQTATQEEQKAYLKQLRRTNPPKPGEPVVGPDPVYEVQVNTVYENATKPNRLIRTYSVNCARNTVAMKMSLVQWRDRLIEDVPPQQFDPIAEAVEPWQVQLVRFACLVGPDPTAKDPAEMMKRGFLPIGDVGQSPANFIWKTCGRTARYPRSPAGRLMLSWIAPNAVWRQTSHAVSKRPLVSWMSRFALPTVWDAII